MRVKRAMTAAGLRLLSGSLPTVGPVPVSSGRRVRSLGRSELVRQRIVFPNREQLQSGLEGFARRGVDSGGQAKAHAELIKWPLDLATDGHSYAEPARESHKADDAHEKLLDSRDTAWRGGTLRTGRLGAYQATQLAALIAALGASLLGVPGTLHARRAVHHG